MEKNKNNLPSTREGLFGDLFDRYARDFFSPYFDMADDATRHSFLPKVEVKEKGNRYEVSAELPGIKEDDLEISLRQNNLIIQGEKRQQNESESDGVYKSEFSYGSFYRTIPLTADVDDKNIDASYQDGILKVVLTKKNDGKDKSIKINVNRH